MGGGLCWPKKLTGNKEIVDNALKVESLINTKLQKLKYVWIESIQTPDSEIGNDGDDDDDDDDDNNDMDNDEDNSSDSNENMDMRESSSGHCTTPLNIEVLPNIS